jgi:hypothetical protein
MLIDIKKIDLLALNNFTIRSMILPVRYARARRLVDIISITQTMPQSL